MEGCDRRRDFDPNEDKERIEALKGANALMFGVASRPASSTKSPSGQPTTM